MLLLGQAERLLTVLELWQTLRAGDVITARIEPVSSKFMSRDLGTLDAIKSQQNLNTCLSEQ
uniref:Uncharacterized protein n=1 Tax=Talaromyces marneffei PM1 TaxID=1077442 RepID=A0A093UQ08_TALMA